MKQMKRKVWAIILTVSCIMGSAACAVPMQEEQSEALTKQEVTRTPLAEQNEEKKETMEEMIESCIPFWLNDDCKTEEDARNKMKMLFPKLKRWKK